MTSLNGILIQQRIPTILLRIERVLVLALRYDIVLIGYGFQNDSIRNIRYPNPLQYNDNLIGIFYVKIVV